MLRESINLATWLTRQVTVYFVKAIGRTTSMELIFQKSSVVLRLLAKSGDRVANCQGNTLKELSSSC